MEVVMEEAEVLVVQEYLENTILVHEDFDIMMERVLNIIFIVLSIHRKWELAVSFFHFFFAPFLWMWICNHRISICDVFTT